LGRLDETLLQTKRSPHPPANIQAIFMRMQRCLSCRAEVVIKQGEKAIIFTYW